jgi:putative transposase
MPRRLRFQHPGAIYHALVRGNARRGIRRDDLDRKRLLAVLGRSGEHFQWRVFAFVVLTYRLHLVLKTPLPNLGRGMRAFILLTDVEIYFLKKLKTSNEFFNDLVLSE